MAAKGTTAAEHGSEPAHREHEAAGKPQLVLVDLARRQTPRQLKRLRKGRGALVTRIDEIVEELVQAGTVKANAQPVVIVVREKVALPWPFANVDYEETTRTKTRMTTESAEPLPAEIAVTSAGSILSEFAPLRVRL